MVVARAAGRSAGRTLLASPRLDLLEDRWVPSTLLVDDDLVQFPNAKYQTIQAAVDAAHSGDTILVAKGTYVEQVIIPAVKHDLIIKSQNSGEAVIQAPATILGANAIVHVDGADDVVIKGFTITGPGVDFGILVNNKGSARIVDDTITKIRDNPLSGNQTGNAIAVGGSGGDGSVVIENDRIADYQKGGIVVSGPHSRADIRHNTITGAGPTALIAQNGIQISDGARAEIRENVISGNVYTPAGTDAAGIYIVDNSGKVEIEENRLVGNEDGILLENSSHVTIEENSISSSTLDGIVLNGVELIEVSENRVVNSGRDGINVQDATHAVIEDNVVKRNGRDGIHISGASSKNLITENDLRDNNRFDAFDDTTGTGTAGTANHWVHNRIGTRSPAGLR